MNTKKLSLANVSLLTIGAMIGSAIFSLSGLTIAVSGNSAVLAWVIAGVLLLVYGLLAAYLARSFPETGGMYLFPTHVLREIGLKEKSVISKIIGTVSTIFYIMGCLAGVIFSLQYIGIYITYLVPNINQYNILVSIIAMLLVFSVNLLQMRNTGRINGVLSVILISILIIYSFIIFTSGHFDLGSVFNGLNLPDAMQSVPTAMLAYGSIVVPAFIAANVVKSRRNVPLSQIIAMTVTILLYVVAIIATLGVVKQSDFVANPGMEYTPFDFALSTIGSGGFSLITNIGAIIALFTTALVVSRLSVISFMQFSENGIFPTVVSQKLRQKNLPNEIIISVIVIICLLFGFLTQFIVDIGAFFNAGFTVIICVTAISLLGCRALKGSQ